MKLYDSNGFANMSEVFNNIPASFIFCLGGRGIGKTYGALKEIEKSNIKFMLMRRTQEQCDMINKSEFSPFKSLMNDNPDICIVSQSISKKNAAFYRGVIDEDGKTVAQGAPIGYTCALSTVASMRGFDASDVEVILYDEFIPEKHERPMRNEGAALLNAYETINRNRELFGKPPVKLIALSNTNTMASPIFAELGLIDIVDKMQRKHREYYIDKSRGIAIIMWQNSPVSDLKKNTALYKITSGSEFERMSINNEFSSDDMSYIKNRPIAEYMPVVVFNDVCIYSHKSRREYYCTRHISGNPPIYKNTELDRKQFKNLYSGLYLQLIAGHMFFSDYYCKLTLTNLFK